MAANDDLRKILTFKISNWSIGGPGFLSNFRSFDQYLIGFLFPP